MDPCDKRRELLHGKNTNLESSANFQNANRVVRKQMTEATEKWIIEQCIIIQKEMIAGDR
ncbi:hypothetical protein DPMN_112352 [Dreissena polymorpha]|uniref:Uncharacterized protein n=1 Tax=Dreissena polymorpha TaxID=45954 RepID=A0A9D4QQT3_DREPO|nr:hypothetical protein DPMN_112352 [Dreissena polymorpha]